MTMLDISAADRRIARTLARRSPAPNSLAELHRQWIAAVKEREALDFEIDERQIAGGVREPAVWLAGHSCDSDDAIEAVIARERARELNAERARELNAERAPPDPAGLEFRRTVDAALDTLDRARGRAAIPPVPKRPIAELAREAREELAAQQAFFDQQCERLGLSVLYHRYEELGEEVARLEKAMLESEPASIDDAAVLLDLACENGIGPELNDREERPELYAALCAFRRLVPSIELYSLRDYPA